MPELARPSLAPAVASVILELQGRLINDAHAAQKQVDADGRFAPVLCFEVVALDGLHLPCYVEQYFPAGQDRQCEAAARRYRRGSVVSFQIDTAALVYKACGASHVHVVTDSADVPSVADETQRALI